MLKKLSPKTKIALLLLLFLIVLISAYFIQLHLERKREEYRKWAQETWEKDFRIVFTEKLYIPKAILPTPYPNEYDIITITPNSVLTANGVYVPTPSGAISIREAIQHATYVLDDTVLDDLEKQFRGIAASRNWTDFSAGKKYRVRFKVPRRVMLKPKRYELVINIPDYKATLYQYYKKKRYVIKSYDCIIGHPLYPTPLGRTSSRTFYWNPVWIPPKSEWAEKYEELEPGGINPLGKAGMIFARVYMIHGTEYPKRLALSHGCVRLGNEDITELVWYLESWMNKPVNIARLKAHRQQLQTKSFWLWRALPVNIVYQPFKVKDKQFIVLQDIYERPKFYSAQRAAKFLQKNGFNGQLDLGKLNKVLSEGRAHKAEITLAHLQKYPDLYGPPLPPKKAGFLFWEKTVTADPYAYNKATFRLVTGNKEIGTMAVDLNAILASANAVQRPF